MAKSRAELPHLYYPPNMYQTRIHNSYVFGGGGGYSPALHYTDIGSDAGVWENIGTLAGYDLVNATVGATQPAIVSAVRNGRQIRRFLDSDDTRLSATIAAADIFPGGASTMYFVLRKTNSTFRHVLAEYSAGATMWLCEQWDNGFTYFDNSSSGGRIEYDDPGDHSFWHILTLRREAGAGAYTAYINGVQVAHRDTTTAASWSGSGTFKLGCQIDNANGLWADIGEFRLYSDAHDPTNRAAIIAEMADITTGWDITLP